MSLGITKIAGRHYVPFVYAAVAQATATASEPIFTAPAACKIYSVKIAPDTAITGADTNSRNMNLDLNGTEKGNIDYASGTDTAQYAQATLVSTAFTMTAGQTITIESEKVGTGLALPSFAGYIELEWTT